MKTTATTLEKNIALVELRRAIRRAHDAGLFDGEVLDEGQPDHINGFIDAVDGAIRHAFGGDSITIVRSSGLPAGTLPPLPGDLRRFLFASWAADTYTRGVYARDIDHAWRILFDEDRRARVDWSRTDWSGLVMEPGSDLFHAAVGAGMDPATGSYGRGRWPVPLRFHPDPPPAVDVLYAT